MTDTHPTSTYGQFCPIAISLDVLGDQWTILLLRDMLWSGALQFNELVDRNPGLTPEVLTDRLATLERNELVTQLDEPKRRWVLTDTGKGIEDIITALYGFGIPLVMEAAVDNRMLEYAVADSSRRRRLDLLDVEQVVTVEMRVGDGCIPVEIAPGSIRVSAQHPVSAAVSMDAPQLAQLMAGMVDFAGHRANGAITVEGDAVAAEQVVNFFLPAAGVSQAD